MWGDRYAWLGIAAAAVAGCTTPETFVLVDLRTDLIPGLEFQEVVTTAAGLEVRVPATRGDDGFAEGTRVAELRGESLVVGALELTVVLLGESGQRVAQKRVVTPLDEPGAYAITMVVGRDCAGLACPHLGDDANATTCRGGRCVAPECALGPDGLCGPEDCEADADCSVPADCADARCERGSCLTRDLGTCGTGQYCDPVAGCRTDVGVACPVSPCRLVQPQCGCADGEGCALDAFGGGLSCQPIEGLGVELDSCVDGGQAACAPGYFCALEGTGEAFCKRFCELDADCPQPGSACANEVGLATGDPSGQTSCTTSCDPVDQTGCPSSFACRLARSGTPARTFVDCREFGTATQGAPCMGADVCAPGLLCLNDTCQRICRPDGQPVCDEGLTCTPSEILVLDGEQLGSCR